MKNKGVTILSIITNIILIAMLCSFIKINGSILKEKQTIKEMSESTQVTDLNNQINALNTEHTEYMNYIQTCKAQLASAITDMGIETSENASIDTMISNIRSISGTSDLDIYEAYSARYISTSSSINITIPSGISYLVLVATSYDALPSQLLLSNVGSGELIYTTALGWSRLTVYKFNTLIEETVTSYASQSNGWYIHFYMVLH